MDAMPRGPRSGSLFLVVLLVGACHHEFDGPVSRDAADHDPDGARAADRRAADRARPSTDWTSPDFCTALEEVKPSTDCRDSASWTCRGSCGGAGHLACLGDGVLRDIRCTEEGTCDCQVGSAAAVSCIRPSLDDGRRGCGLAQEVLLLGCCKP
jgi:hypothetical protein